jgi:hypothetical protein
MRQRRGSTRPAFARLEGRLLNSHLLQGTVVLPGNLSSRAAIVATPSGQTPSQPGERGAPGSTIPARTAAANGVQIRDDPSQSMDDMIAMMVMGPAATDNGHGEMTASASIIAPQLMTPGPHGSSTPDPVMVHSPRLTALKLGAIVPDRQHGEMKGDFTAAVVDPDSPSGEPAEAHPLGLDAGLEVRLDADPGTSAGGVEEGRSKGEPDRDARPMEGGMQGPIDGPKAFPASNSSIERSISALLDAPGDAAATIPEETTAHSDATGDGMGESFSTMGAAILVIVPLVSRGRGIDSRRLPTVADRPTRWWRCLLRLFGSTETPCVTYPG